MLRWPQQRADLERLDRNGQPRLLLVEAGVAPPSCGSCLEDWIRLPASDDDIRARLVALGEHAARHPAAPRVDPWGELTFRDASVFLSPRERSIAHALAKRFRTAVSEEELIREAWPDGDGPATALRVHVHRLRKRIGPIGLAITTLRGYGYMMSDPD